MALYSKTGISKIKHFLNLDLKLFLETHKDNYVMFACQENVLIVILCNVQSCLRENY